MLNLHDKILLETEHLYIRYWKPTDMFSLKKYAGDVRLAYMAGWLPIRTYFQAWYRISNGYPKPWCFCIADKQTNRAIGSISFMREYEGHVPLNQKEAEVGYWIAREYWGQGLMAEAARAVFDYVFSKRGIEKIWIVIDVQNPQSLRVQEKLGFRYNRCEDIELEDLHRRMYAWIASLSNSDWSETKV